MINCRTTRHSWLRIFTIWLREKNQLRENFGLSCFREKAKSTPWFLLRGVQTSPGIYSNSFAGWSQTFFLSQYVEEKSHFFWRFEGRSGGWRPAARLETRGRGGPGCNTCLPNPPGCCFDAFGVSTRWTRPKRPQKRNIIMPNFNHCQNWKLFWRFNQNHVVILGRG